MLRRFLALVLVPGILFAATLTSSHLRAQEALLSLSGSTALPTGLADDEEVLLVQAGKTPRRWLSDQTLALHFGDRNGDALFDEPNDVDALEVVSVPAGTPVAAGVYFSLLQDQGGFHDGDILRFVPGAIEPVQVFLSEQQIVAAVQANDGNVDVDAIAFLDDGSLLFSLAEDETSGPNKVVVFDDDVLRLVPGAAFASVWRTGAEMEAMVEHALGGAASIGDVKGLESQGGTLFFTVQSPSSDDATVFSSAGGGSVFLAEAQMGFASAAEADALAFPTGPVSASARFSSPQAVAGNNLFVEFEGLTPGAPFVLLLATAARLEGTSFALPGWGSLVLDPSDPMFLVSLAMAPALVAVADGQGHGAYFGTVPPTTWPYDLVAQAYDVASGSVSAPAVLEVNQ